MNKIKSATIEFYYDWMDNYTSYEQMAKDYEIDVLQVHYLIQLGMEWDKERIKRALANGLHYL